MPLHTQTHFYAQTPFRTLFFHTQALLHTTVFIHRQSHTDGFHNCFYTETFSRWWLYTHTHAHTHTFLQKHTFTQRGFLHTDVFTHTQTHAFLHTHDGFQNVVFWFGWYISRNSMRAASCLALKNYDLSKLNCLKPCIFSFMCETAPKTWRTSIWSRCHCELSRGTGRYVHLLQGFPLPLQVLWRRLGHGSAKAVLCNFC